MDEHNDSARPTTLMVISFGKMLQRRERPPFPDAWLPWLHEHVFLYRLLPEAEQAELRSLVAAFIPEKYWEGCAGLEMNDEIKVAIAGQACLLLLGLNGYLFDELKTILVYPGGFLSREDDPLGREDEQEYRLGEAHHGGPVILSWWEANWGGRRLGSMNVVLHEFAHKLAELGDADAGRPPLQDAAVLQRWEQVVGREFAQLIRDAQYDRPTLLDPYGATSRAEFFAVATEAFYLQPRRLRRRHRELFDVLVACYGKDPGTWNLSPETDTAAREAEVEYQQHALGELNALIQQRPQDIDAHRERALLHQELGDYERSLQDYATLLSLVSADERPEVLYDRGSILLEAGLYQEAIETFDQTLSLVPDHARALSERGMAFAALGQPKRALNDLTQSLQLDPDDDATLVERGLVYHEMGKNDKALRDLTRAIKLSPHSATAWSNRAMVHLAREAYDEVLLDCERALRLDPSMPEPYQHRGVARLRQGDLESALADLNEAIRLDPEYGDAYSTRAEVHEARKQPQLAQADRDKAAALAQ